MLKTALLFCAVGLTASVPLQQVTQCGYEQCTDAEPDKLNIHIVPHTHDDVGWLKTVDQYYYGSRNEIQKAGVQYILDSVIKELWFDPKRRFIYVETAFFWKWWVQQPPALQARVRALVSGGRLVLVGGAWSMNDEAAAHYQSTIDQFTWGLRKLNDTFGSCAAPRVIWQIDPFGHSREMASLASMMGYDGVFHGRIDYQDKRARLGEKRMEMVWRGNDDLGKSSDIFTGILYNTYSPPPGFCFDVLCNDEPIIDDITSPLYNVNERVSRFLEITQNMSHAYATKNILVTMGEDFQYQDAAMWYINLDKLIEYGNLKAAKNNMNMKLFYSTPNCYLKAVKDANPKLPTKQDDFFPYASDSTAFWTGYFTSRPTTKYFERAGNSYLQMVKQLHVLAGLEYRNVYVLNELKSAMGIMQHHDAVTGTEKEHVARDYVRILTQAIDDANVMVKEVFNKYMTTDASKPSTLEFTRCHLNESSCRVSETRDQFVVTVYNHLAWEVHEAIRIPVQFGVYDVYAPNGEIITSQLVDIPEYVAKIPTRESLATHEIVFIAYLHPVSYKSYYIKKSQSRLSRDAFRKGYMDKEIFGNNDLFEKSIKNPIPVDKSDKEVLATKVKSPMYRNIESGSYVVSHNVKDIDVDENVNNEEKLQNGGKDNTETDGDKGAVKNEEGLMGDDPIVVTRYPVEEEVLPNFLIITNIIALREVQPDTKSEETTTEKADLVDSISDIAQDKTKDVIFDVDFLYYPGCAGNNAEPAVRSSGAYIFRPNATEAYNIDNKHTKGPSGKVTQEIRINTDQNVASTIRIYEGLLFVEHDWVVGPIPIKDHIGKEYIVRYKTNINNNGEFYTDSNGRQMLKRKLNERPTWNLTLAEPIPGNYYPVTNKIYITDASKRISVLTDRSEGGTSLKNGQIELMLHRRLLYDDAFGVGEALNEVEEGHGLVVRGRHRILINNADDKDSYIKEKKSVLQFHLQPIVFVSDAKDLTLDGWLKMKKAYSWVNELPEGLHLLTVEPWSREKMLLRLENYLERADKKDATITVDLDKIFKFLKLESFAETTLAANQWLDGQKKWEWDHDDDFVDDFNKNYGRDSTKPKPVPTVSDEGFNIKLKPKQIRTFIVNYRMKQ